MITYQEHSSWNYFIWCCHLYPNYLYKSLCLPLGYELVKLTTAYQACCQVLQSVALIAFLCKVKNIVFFNLLLYWTDMCLPQLLHRLSVMRLNLELGYHCCLPCLKFMQSLLPFFANFCIIENISASCTAACLKVECCLQASRKTILQRRLLCFTLLAFYQMVSVDPPPHCTEFLYNWLWSNLMQYCFCGKGMVLTSCTAGTSQQKHDLEIWQNVLVWHTSWSVSQLISSLYIHVSNFRIFIFSITMHFS